MYGIPKREELAIPLRPVLADHDVERRKLHGGPKPERRGIAEGPQLFRLQPTPHLDAFRGKSAEGRPRHRRARAPGDPRPSARSRPRQ